MGKPLRSPAAKALGVWVRRREFATAARELGVSRPTLRAYIDGDFTPLPHRRGFIEAKTEGAVLVADWEKT